MWLNKEKITPSAIKAYQLSLYDTCPNYVVIDELFNQTTLNAVLDVLVKDTGWQTQQHTYSSLYVEHEQWQHADAEHRFVQRSAWQRPEAGVNTAESFLQFLRSDEFLQLLSRIFKVVLTDRNVENPDINSNYFRLGQGDFIGQHADDSPGREVCMLLYLNKNWHSNMGGELNFLANDSRNTPIKITPLHNRCVLFNPASKGSEHWVELLNKSSTSRYRYNVTSWYWSE